MDFGVEGVSRVVSGLSRVVAKVFGGWGEREKVDCLVAEKWEEGKEASGGFGLMEVVSKGGGWVLWFWWLWLRKREGVREGSRVEDS